MARKLTKKNPLRSLRNKNRHIILELLRERGPISIPEIARAGGFSKMTVHKLIEQLIEDGLALDAGKGEVSEDGGKKPTLFAFNGNYKYVFAVKITGYELLTGITDLCGGILSSQTDSFSRSAGLDDILKLIVHAFNSLTERQELDVGECLGAIVGSHGMVDAETGICLFSPHFLSWGKNVPLRKLIQEILPDHIPVIVDNWLRFHAYAEMKTDGQEGRKHFFILGTEHDGLAGGLVLNGQIHHGVMGLAGEIGHMAINKETQAVCVCGGRRCFEVAVSPKRMEERVGRERGNWPESVLGKAKSRRERSFQAVLTAANREDAFARALLDDAIEHFAVALNCIVQICDPGLIIILGEYAAAGEYFRLRLEERLQEMSLTDMRKKIAVEYSSLGSDGFLFGASMFMADDLFSKIGEWTPDELRARL